jgi:hypothetical protein
MRLVESTAAAGQIGGARSKRQPIGWRFVANYGCRGRSNPQRRQVESEATEAVKCAAPG